MAVLSQGLLVRELSLTQRSTHCKGSGYGIVITNILVKDQHSCGDIILIVSIDNLGEIAA